MATQYISIQQNLAQLYQKWKDYSKNERQGYQTFLTNFFECFGITFDDPNKLPFEENTGKGFADAFIKDIVIVEMKDKNKIKTKADLLEVLPQALKYWEGKGKHVPYLVLCNFHDFIVHDTRDSSNHHIKLADLENKVDSFNFLLKLNPTFVPEQEAVSRKSAKLMGQMYQSLKGRLRSQDDEVDLFVLQCLFCLFSEDIGYLPSQTFTNCVRRIKDGEDNSANILSTLFKMMDEKDGNRKKGRFENVRYFNGPLFRIKPEIVLNDEEVELLWQSCQMDWKNVRPEIFGALFESSQSKKARHKDGMHFTSEEDIMKVVKPCILDPWNDDFDKCKTQADFRDLHKRLKSYRVLDPACGSGNFLVVAYRELKALEARIFMEYKRLSGESYSQVQETLEWFPVTNMYGIEINAFPSFLTRVSLWISKKLAKNQYKFTEPDLPLEELKHIIAADALEVKWDDVDVVVGNPPYIGCKKIREARGNTYFKWLGTRFKDHNKMSDYCTYWFEKVLEDVKPGVRVGLVCTKTVSQTNSRAASLDKVVGTGGEIFNAISIQKWSGEAAVHVSIINFINKATFSGQKVLDGKVVPAISTRLKSEKLTKTSGTEARPIPENANKAFVGIMVNGMGFILSDEEKKAICREDQESAKVIKPFLTGEDILHNPDQSPSRWIIDFQDWPLEGATKFRAAFARVKTLVKPERDKKNRERHKKYWWRFAEDRMGMREAVEKLQKIIATPRVSKHPVFCMIDNNKTLPSDQVVVIASDNYSVLGTMQSRFHVAWYHHQCSTFGTGLRYTNSTVFETFPFPDKHESSVAKCMKDIESYREKACKEHELGLTDLYNSMNEGGHEILKKLHEKLDEEVGKTYGLKNIKTRSDDELVDFLTKVNLARTEEFAATGTDGVKSRVLAKAKKTLEKAEKKGTRKRG